MVENRIQVGASDDYLETALFNDSEGRPINREGVFVGDPDDVDATVKVTNCRPAPTDYGLTTRPVQNLDGFGRLRISEPVSMFDSQLQYDEMDLIWNEKLTTSGTFVHDANGSFGTMNTTTTSGSEVIRQSPYQRYQPGKSQLVFATFDMVEEVDNQRKRVGYFDGANGLYLENLNGITSITLRSSVSGGVVNDNITQANWNQDKMDGTGPSGVTLDITKSLIWCADFEWLGVGQVRVGFVIQGQFYAVHIFMHSNDIQKTYMGTANLPVRYEITNTAITASAGKMRQICCSVMSEGGFREDFGFEFAAGNGVTTKAATTTAVPLITIRPKATFNSIVNRGIIVPEEFGFFPQTNAGFMQVIYNGTLSGSPSWVSANANSIVEYDISATGISGGIDFTHSHADAGGAGSKTYSDKSSGDLTARYPLQLDIDGNNPTHMTLCFTSMLNTCDAVGHMSWKEIR
jgi:hypothetical protein